MHSSLPINHIVFFSRIPVVLENRRSSRGGGAHPLHLPPRSAPAPSKAAISTPKRGSWYHSLLCGFRRGGEGGSIFSCLFLLNGLTLHVRHIGFASSAILKILQQTCTASVGSDSLSYGPLHSNSLSYPILSYPILNAVDSQQHHPRSPTSYRNVRNIGHESFEWPFSP